MYSTYHQIRQIKVSVTNHPLKDEKINQVSPSGALCRATKAARSLLRDVNEKARKLYSRKGCIAVDKVEKHPLLRVELGIK